MTQTKRPVAIAYRRVSTEKQGKSGLGLADQDARIKAFCAERGLTLVAEFTEVESGKNDARPQLAKALQAVKRTRGLLVVATLSRLGRKVSFVAGLMDRCVPFACADSPDDEPFFLHMKASLAEDEAHKISKRTKAAMAVRKAQGVRFGTPANLSQEGRIRGGAVLRERAALERATILPQVKALRRNGESVRAIAEQVGVSPITVSRILKTVS